MHCHVLLMKLCVGVYVYEFHLYYDNSTWVIMASLSLDGDYDFVEPKPLEFDDYLCPVSYELLTDPRQANECCGKHLSREVAERLERDGKPCPLCTTAPLRTCSDMHFKRKVLALSIYCKNKKFGCDWNVISINIWTRVMWFCSSYMPMWTDSSTKRASKPFLKRLYTAKNMLYNL